MGNGSSVGPVPGGHDGATKGQVDLAAAERKLDDILSRVEKLQRAVDSGLHVTQDTLSQLPPAPAPNVRSSVTSGTLKSSSSGTLAPRPPITAGTNATGGQTVGQYARDPIHARRKTGIVCTIGPKTATEEMVGKLIENGASILRLNFSHGSHEYHGSVVKNIRSYLAKHPERTCAIALDTKGPEIRTGDVEGGEIKLEAGSTLVLTTDTAFAKCGTASRVYVDYAGLPRTVTPGFKIYIDDGLITLTVASVSEKDVTCSVINSAVLGGRKGVNLPLACPDLPAVSDKDKEDLAFAVEQDVDFVFASFIRKASHVREIRELLGERGKHIRIVAKIENHEGLDNFEEILAETDGVMVARGDLGIEIPIEKVFVAQKMLIAQCNAAGKPVICATQMLESMTFNPRPTRAECTDVGTGVLDGSDCVMLSGETAKGTYPIESVVMMGKICQEAESVIDHKALFRAHQKSVRNPVSVPEAVASSAVHATIENNASLIVVMSNTGATARWVSKYRPPVPALVVTADERTARQCLISRGLVPFLCSEANNYPPDPAIDKAIAFARKEGLVKIGDRVTVIHFAKEADGRTHNLLKILNVWY